MIQIIPAIDVIDGKCVRLQQGDFNAITRYDSDPLEMAMRFEDHGIERLHLVDLDGARAKHIINHRVLEGIASKTNLVIDFGGGLRSESDIRIAFNSGAAAVTGGSVAVQNRDLFLDWLKIFGPQKIFLGADFKDGHIAVSGWEEMTEISLPVFLDEFYAHGVRTAICTDISRDGMLEGPSMQIYNQIKLDMPGLFLIASGGISGMEDIINLQEEGIEGVIVGKALYEGKIELKVIKDFILKRG